MEPDFETIVRCAMWRDPDLRNWKFAASLEVHGVTSGRAPAGEHEWQPDRERMIELARRTVQLTGSLGLDDVAMRERLGLPPGCAAGWYPLIVAFDDMCRDAGHPVMSYVQIKSWVGSLGIYHRSDDYSRDLELTAARLSTCVCEICGAPGRLRGSDGWWATRCDDHAGEPA